ncbi:ash family protein [Vibrio fluvialis]|nr:ash family protein [Vibrio fluvialis]
MLVFLCAASAHLHIVTFKNNGTITMVGWAGQPSGWPCRWCGSPNPVQSITRRLGPLRDGKIN